MTTADATSVLFHHSLVLATVTRSYELGQVKVRFPWMGPKQESDWVRIMAPTAGKGCGVFFMPEEGDQVLVAFSHSRTAPSYIIGGLWSDASKPPHKDRAKRQIRSRSGHTITLDDTKHAELISIVDKSGKNKIVLDAGNNNITIECSGDLTITAGKNLALKSGKGNVSLNGQNITLDAGAKLSAKGPRTEISGTSGVKINKGALEVT